MKRILLLLSCLLVSTVSYAENSDVNVLRDSYRNKVFAIKPIQKAEQSRSIKASAQIKSASLLLDHTRLAKELLSEYAGSFGIKDIEKELSVIDVSLDELNIAHIKFQQIYENIPVFDGKIIVHLKPDGSLHSINGNIVEILNSVNVQPSLTSDEAVSTAGEEWQKIDNANYFVSEKELYIYTESDNKNAEAHLVWQIVLENPNTTFSRSFLVDAHSGDVLSIKDLSRGLDDKIKTVRYIAGTPTSPQNVLFNQYLAEYDHTYGRTEGQPPRGPMPIADRYKADCAPLDSPEDLAYIRTKQLSYYYLERLGRDGANGSGGTMVESAWNVPYDPAIDLIGLFPSYCPVDASTYASGNIRISADSELDFTLAHEYLHSVEFYTLNYYSEYGGALEEGIADIMGEAFRRYVTGKHAYRLEYNEKYPLPDRNFKTPTLGPSYSAEEGGTTSVHPSTTYDESYRCSIDSNYLAHINSTVVSHAAYLAATGSEKDGCKPYAIGWDPIAKSWFRARLHYFVENTTFLAAIEYVMTACNDLYPNEKNPNELSGICYQIKKSMLAVRMDKPGLCNDPEGTYNTAPICDFCPNNPYKDDPGCSGDCNGVDVDSDGDGTPDCADQCPNNPLRLVPDRCGCDFENSDDVLIDNDLDGYYAVGSCPEVVNDCDDNHFDENDPFVEEIPNDHIDNDCDGLTDEGSIIDNCPDDPNKTSPGQCGCGNPDTDSDGDGAADCVDSCPMNQYKTAPGKCGCGAADTDANHNGTIDCLETCPNSTKPTAGACGCDVPDTDTDGDGLPDCLDNCPFSSYKVVSGICGCGMPDEDKDNDGVLDCLAPCPNSNKDKAGVCGCGTADTDSDNDTLPDCLDRCPNNPSLVEPDGICGCSNDPAYCESSCDGQTSVYAAGAGTQLDYPTVITRTTSLGSDTYFNNVKLVGDINHDGYDDLMVGDPTYNNDKGRILVFLGSVKGINENESTEIKTTSASKLATSIVPVGDINNDGYDDVLIGTANGYLAYLGASSVSSSNIKTSNIFPAGQATAIGDINSDGYDDILISENGSKVKYYYGADSLSSMLNNSVIVDSGNSETSFGTAVAGIGDVNGDGKLDIAVSAPYANTYKGRVYVYLGETFEANSKITLNNPLTTSGISLFGYSIAGAGDVNGDGYGDVLVGDIQGHAFIFFGASDSPLSTSKKVPFLSNEKGVTLVAKAGDLNNDGYDDILVGRPSNNNSDFSNVGTVDVFFGYKRGVSSALAESLVMNWGNTNFGKSLSIGDVNGDGYSDFVVGSDYASLDDGTNADTFAIIYHSGIKRSGDVNINGIIDCAECLNGNKPTAGQCGCGVPDTDSDNDGTPDCIDKCPYDANKTEIGVCGCGVPDSASNLADSDKDGVPACNDACPNSVDTSIVTGLSTTSVWSITGATTAVKLGKAVAIAGDVNGDGFDDVLVGDSKNKLVNVFYGSVNGLAATADLQITSDKISFGSVVSGAGDINGDGFDDVLVSAPEYNSKKGIIYLYLGSSNGLSTTANATFTATVTNGYYGYVLSKVGDVNADGYDDFVIASPKYNTNRGRYTLYLGQGSGTPIASVTETGSTSAALGSAVTPLGDFDKDGYADFAIASTNATTKKGVVYVHYGNSLGKSLPRYAYRGTTGEVFGSAIAGVGDISGNGYPTLIITSPIDRRSGTKVTYSYLLFNYGGNVQKEVPSGQYWLYAKKTNAQLGEAVANVGDVDGTGSPKYIVSIPKDGNGRIILSPTLKSNGEFDTEWTLTASKASEFVGAVLAGNGDINGDGYADVIIGTPNYSSGKGRVQLFTGGAKRSTTVTCPTQNNPSRGVRDDDDVDDEVNNDDNLDEDTPHQSDSIDDGEIPQSIDPNTCYDGDNGKKITDFGQVLFKGAVFEDSCSKKILTEYYCKNNTPTLKLYRCANGCKKGVCLSKKTKKLTCSQKNKQKKLQKKLKKQLKKLNK